MSLFNTLANGLRDGAFSFIGPSWDSKTELAKLVESRQHERKVAIVTGGSVGGCGYEVLKGLAQVCEAVYVFGRNPQRNDTAIKSLPADHGARAFSITCDLGSLASIREAAGCFYEQESKRTGKPKEEVRLDILVENAGVLSYNTKDKTADGFESMWGTNCLGHHALVRHLLPSILNTAALAQSSQGSPPRIIIVSSGAHAFVYSAEHNFYPLAEKLKSDLGKGTMALYARSKCANILDQHGWLQHFASLSASKSTTNRRETAADQIIVTTVHPGGIRSELGRQHNTAVLRWTKNVINYFLWPTEAGAVNMLWSALAADEREVQGKYVQPWCSATDKDPPAALARDQKLAKEHWEFMEDIVESERVSSQVATQSS